MSTMNITDITDNGNKLLVRVISGKDWPSGIQFYTEDDHFIQVATMNYEENHHMKAHRHNVYERTVMRTNEVFVIIDGRVGATVYDDNGEVMEHVLLSKGDIAIFFAGGHAFDVIDDDTRIIEIKNGPFFGVEKDKTFIHKGEDN